MKLRLALSPILITCVGACVLLGCATFARRHIYPTHKIAVPKNAGRFVHGIEKIWIETPQGKVEAWFIAGIGVGPQRPGPAVLYAHGNLELIDTIIGRVSGYRPMGVSVLLAEYRGYGRSAGTPSKNAFIADFGKLYDLLKSRPEIDPDRILFHGRSLGGGVVCALSKTRTPAALILESTFSTFAKAVFDLGAPTIYLPDKYNNIAVVTKFQGPVLIIHGQHDRSVHFDHALALKRVAKRGRLLIYDIGHSDYPPYKAYWANIEAFLRDHALLP